MAKFIFKFQSLLNLKHQLEENAKQELGKAVQALQHENDLFTALELERENHIRGFSEDAEKLMPIQKLKEMNRYIVVLKERMNSQKKRIQKAEDNVEQERKKLIVVVQEREILDKLKEKSYQEFIKEQQKQEQLQIDEVTNFRYVNANTLT